jgi:hypothetical protein
MRRPIFLVDATLHDLQHAIRKAIVSNLAHNPEAGLKARIWMAFGPWLEIDQVRKPFPPERC